jgi:transcriptional regulator NrdR family protein
LQTPAGKLIPFKKEKLFLSIYKSCEHRPSALDDAIALTQTVMAKVTQSDLAPTGKLPTSLLANSIFDTLMNFDKVSAVQYSAYHPEYVNQKLL